jgi:UTP:GlnB (protein PII) uridylyltransferase
MKLRIPQVEMTWSAHAFNGVRKRIPTLFARATMFIMQTAERVLATLRAHEVELRQAGLRSLSLLGSLARGELKTGSDIDLAAGGHENEITGIVQLDF